MCCVELGVHIQAFTFSSQDHGRLSDKHISKHSRWRHSQDHGRLTGVWCGVCGVLCFVCVHVACVVCGLCVYMWCCVYNVVLCVVLVVCVCVCCFVVVVRVCGEGWSLAHYLSLLLSLLPLFFPFRFPFLLLSYLYFSLLFLFFSLAPSLTLALALVLSLFLLSLFSSRHQTLRKESINQHGGQHRGIWVWSGAGQVHSSRFSPSSSPLPPPFSPSPPQKKKEGTFHHRNISGEEFISNYSFKLIPKTRRRGKLQ